MKSHYTDLPTTSQFARDQAATQLQSESAQSTTLFYSATGSLNHANLRRHLQEPMSGTFYPPRFTRQDAFLRGEFIIQLS